MTAEAVEVRLLGKPALVLGGRTLDGPRGRKTWALLAFLLLAAAPPTRIRLAELFFPSALDPRGALRWSIADLNRLLAPVGSASGDPVLVDLPPETFIDVWQVLDRGPGAPVACRCGELLEGLAFPTSEPLDRWLEWERRRLSLACVDVLTSARDRAAQEGHVEQASGLTADLVVIDPYDDTVSLFRGR